MKKLIIVLIIITVLVGCSMSNTPSGRVEEYLSKFNSVSDEVMIDLETKINHEDLSSENKSLYKEALIRVYKNLKYEIKDESVNGDKAEVKAVITVYDLHKADTLSMNYMNDNVTEFYDSNGLFSNDLYNKYRIEQMIKTNESIQYEVVFNLYKKDNNWILESPDEDVLAKLNGLYNYDN